MGGVRVLHVCASLAVEWGGPPAVVVSLSNALGRKGVRCSVFSTDFPVGGHVIPTDSLDVSRVPVAPLARWWPAYSPSLGQALKKAARDVDIIHIHELWHYPHYAAYRAARFLNVPYVISVHGALEPWALRYKSVKKRLYMSLVQRNCLKNAAALHAMTCAELTQIRSQGLENLIKVIPNGVDVDDYRILPESRAAEIHYPNLAGKQVILFLGRIHRKKGLDLLAKAFGAIARDRADLHLVIAGPDETGYKADVESLLYEEGVLDKVTFTGMIRGNDKLAMLARADIFVLSSYSEGFSMSLLEALACGLPLVVTHECNFPEVAEAGAGITIRPDVTELRDALSGLLDDAMLRKRMGEAARQLVADSFTWDSVAGKMVDLYDQVLSGGTIRDAKA